jgi:hypothetical protein
MVMKRLLATGCALGLLGAGSIAFATLAGAQEPPPDLDLAAMLSPGSVAPGATITVTSDDRCDTSTGDRFLYWDVWPAEEEAFTPGQEVDLGMQDLQADGSWQVGFDAPATAGSYNFWPLCASRDGDWMIIEQEYAPLPFTVQPQNAPPTSAPPTTTPPVDRDVPDQMPWPELPGQSPEAMPVATPMPMAPTFTG